MVELGKHSIFILWSYGIVALVLALLIAWLAWDWRRRNAQVAELKARGVRRRSDAVKNTPA